MSKDLYCRNCKTKIAEIKDETGFIEIKIKSKNIFIAFKKGIIKCPICNKIYEYDPEIIPDEFKYLENIASL